MKAVAAVLLVFAFGMAGAHAACVQADGIGGTGISMAAGGIGGTGIKRDGGIGGTGLRAQGDLGIIGIITGFGSICVNGLEVHYGPDTPVVAYGRAAQPDVLAIGQVVAVNAIGNAVQIRAQRIQVVDAAVGPVTGFDAAARELQVAGQLVRLDEAAVLAPGVALEKAGNVRVSGLWRADGTITATRIDAAPDATPSVVRSPNLPELGASRLIVQGYVAESGTDTVRIAGTTFKVDPKLAAELTPDRLVRVSVRVERDGSKVVERAEILAAPLNPRPERTLGDRSGRRSSGGPEHQGQDARNPRVERPARPVRPDRNGRR